jgi:hypothetical protein
MMNSAVSPEREGLPLVDIIQLKWLMSREGHRVHVERLQRDPEYARECLAQAQQCQGEAARACAQRLAAQLQG